MPPCFLSLVIPKDSAVGVKLAQGRDGGAFIDSFYRKQDGTLLPAEGANILRLGDRIYSINSVVIYQLSLVEINNKIMSMQRPLTIEFKRLQQIEGDGEHISLLSLIRDPHSFVWIDFFLTSGLDDINDSEAQEAASLKSFHLANKLLLLSLIDIVMHHAHGPDPSQPCERMKQKLLDSCMQSGKTCNLTSFYMSAFNELFNSRNELISAFHHVLI